MERSGRSLVVNAIFLLFGLGSVLGAFTVYRVTQLPAKKKKKKRRGFRFIVRTKPVHQGKIAVTLRLTGDVMARRSVVLRSEVSGVIRRIRAREGASVKHRRPVVYLQNIDQLLQMRKQKALMEQAKAGVIRAKVGLAKETDAYQRTRRLRRSRVVSQSAFIEARFRKQAAAASLAESKALVSLRKAEWAIARRNLSKTAILAPFNGTIVKLHVEKGKLVNRGDVIADLIATDKVEVRLFIPPRYIKRVRVGMKVQARVAGSGAEWLDLRLKRLLPSADAHSRNRFGIAVVDKPPADFLPGLPVEARVVVAEKAKALLVPKDALIRAGGSWVLYKVKKGKAIQTPVQYKNEHEGQVEVAGNLAPGDPIVTVGNEALFPNAPVSTGRFKRKGRKGKKRR